MDDEEPKPVGSGVFGNIYNQFKGKVKEAFDFLMKHKGGDLLGVFHRKDVGDIDLVWGDENGRLAHILNKHVGEGKSFANVDEAMSHIQDIVETGKNDFEDGDKIVFRKGSELVTVRKNFREGDKK
nr:MAG TPA: crystallin beta/gamma motif-containing protein [Microviridae sp.]